MRKIKKIIIGSICTLLLGGFILYQYNFYSGLWRLKVENPEIGRLLNRGYLVITPIEEKKVECMVEDIGVDKKIPLARKSYFQDEEKCYEVPCESYRWRISKGNIKIFFCDEWDTISDIQKRADGKIYATYYLLGDDGSMGEYLVEVK